MSKFKDVYGDRMRKLEGVKVFNIEEGCGFIKCPHDEAEIQILEDVLSKCPNCNTQFTMEQENVVYVVEEE